MKKEYHYSIKLSNDNIETGKVLSYSALKELLKEKYATDQGITIKDIWTEEGKKKQYKHQNCEKIFRLSVEEYYKNLQNKVTN